MTLSVALESSYSSAKSVFELIGLLVVCILVFVASYYVTKFVGNKQKGTLERGNFKNIDIYRLSATKYLQIIQIGKKYALISVTKDEIRLIMELSEEDILKWPSEGKKTSFKDIISNIKNKGNTVAGSSENKTDSDDISTHIGERNIEESALDDEFEKIPLILESKDKSE